MARVIYMRVTIEFYLTKGLMYYGEHYAVDIPYCDSRYICGSYYRSAEKTRQENTPDAGCYKGGVATVEAATASNEDSGEKVEKAAEADAEKK